MDTQELKNQQDEELFSSLEKNKKKKKRKRLITVITIVAIVILALIITVSVLQKRVTNKFAESDNYLTAEAGVGSISTTVSGSGQLAEVDEEGLTVPAGVKVDEVIVSSHDTVAEGDVIATLDIASVMSAMSDIQSEIDDLDEDLYEAEKDSVSSSVKAGVSGRVKKIFAAPGDSVLNCMYSNGALALLSLDGYMAVDIENDSLCAGDSVYVLLESGKTVNGAVESAGNGACVVLVSDDGPACGETVSVCLEDGTELGSGELYIHNPLSITGISGTVSRVNTAENKKVYSNSVVFTLKDTSYSANYDSLLKDRNEKEQTLVELVGLYRSGALLAPFSGSVSSVDYDEEKVADDEETDIITLSPDVSMSVSIDVDESDILSIEVGQSADITVDSIGEDAFTGEVTKINKTATSASGVTRYSAEITLPKVPGMLAGMSASVVIRIQGVDGAVIIPVDALHQTSATSYVYTGYDEETKEFTGLKEVVAGISNSSYVEIISGLNPGETVCYEKPLNFGFSFYGMNNSSSSVNDIPAGDYGGRPEGGTRPDGGSRPDGGPGGNSGHKASGSVVG